jgi:hypothetical protein
MTGCDVVLSGRSLRTLRRNVDKASARQHDVTSVEYKVLVKWIKMKRTCSGKEGLSFTLRMATTEVIVSRGT